MIKHVETLGQLKKFIYFPKKLYKNENHYVYPLFHLLNKELKKLVLHDHRYHALLAYKDNEVVGRVIFTYDESKHRGEKVCYFSMFDVIDDKEISKALFEEIYKDMRVHQITYLEGTFTPYDPDTRRGILIEGFDDDPALFTSYNYPYYQEHFVALGFEKAFDTLLSDGGRIDQRNQRMLKRLFDYTTKHHDIQIDYIDFKHIDRDIKDIHDVILSSNHEIIYQDPPSIETLYEGFYQMKAFINPDFVTIARETKTKKPIGFALVLPDFNQLIKKAKGRVIFLPFINKKKTITNAIGKMQYVIPEYQERGVMPSMYYKIIDKLLFHNMKTIEMGTFMESNYKSFNHFSKFGGEVKKVFRIYGKEIQL